MTAFVDSSLSGHERPYVHLGDHIVCGDLDALRWACRQSQIDLDRNRRPVSMRPERRSEAALGPWTRDQ